MHKRLLLFLFLLLPLAIQAQRTRNINLKYFGLSLHPRGDENANLMPLNPDGNGYFVLNVGASIAYEQFFIPNKFSIKAIQALYADCALRFAGFTHLGIRGVVFQAGKHSLNGGIGPTLVYRRNWSELEGYNRSNSFFDGGPDDKWQYRMIWYAGEFEYNYRLSERTDFSTTFVPGYPDLINLSFGIRYWLKDKEE